MHTGALAADVAGAALPFVTGAGQAYRAGNKLVDVAQQAGNAVSAGGTAQSYGMKVHSAFDDLLGAGAGGKRLSGETSYVNQSWDGRYRPTGSSNPDAVLGNVRTPTAVYDLKTGQSGISNAQMNRYNSNLPDGTPVYMVTPSTHNVPRPGSWSGVGAGFNSGSLLGSALK